MIWDVAGFFLNLLGMIRILVIYGCIGFVIVKIVQIIKKYKLLNIKGFILSGICIIIATASFIFNIGWYRFAMMMVLLPIIQPILFLAINLIIAKHCDKIKFAKLVNYIFIITYLVFWVFLPDGGDAGSMYLFFGLVHNDELAIVGEKVSFLAGIIHIVCLAIHIVQIVILKKNRAGQ